MTSVAAKSECSLNACPSDTQVLPVFHGAFRSGTVEREANDLIKDWNFTLNDQSTELSYLQQAAHELQTSDVPVAFPTETVYGLGADATRSSAVQGIFKAKNRPSDNPLIVHVASLDQLRELLRPAKRFREIFANGSLHTGNANGLNVDQQALSNEDPIPEIYKPLISKFWPGPLTLIMPNPTNTILAPEVTAGLSTFGVRMPSNPLALILIKMANVPVAAPSANASTKPSPTTAEHVKHDLDGRIKFIIDGGPCAVGLESTVVDGLSETPLILRPGGVSIDELRECPGWNNVQIGYKDVPEAGKAPKAPGMKYKHYSPKAKVILFESHSPIPTQLIEYCGSNKRLGIIRTKWWTSSEFAVSQNGKGSSPPSTNSTSLRNGQTRHHQQINSVSNSLEILEFDVQLDSKTNVKIFEISLGVNAEDIARGLFSALRDLDLRQVDAILVEGIDDSSGDTAAAIMNRLRKASDTTIPLR